MIKNIKLTLIGILAFIKINYAQSYSKYINTAELSIYEGNLNLAISYYDSAFRLVKFPFPKDIYNQLICAEKTKNYNLLNKNLNFILSNYNIQLGLKRKIKKHINEENLNLIRNKELKVNRLTFLIDSLYILDQKVRTSSNYAHNQKKIREVDSISFDILNPYLQKMNEIEDATFHLLLGLNQPLKSHFYILVRHWFQSNFKTEELFKSLVLQNKFPAYTFADLSDIQNGTILYKSKYGIMFTIRYGSKRKKIPRTKQEIETIDHYRNEIGLHTYQDYLKLVSFFEQNDDFIFYKDYIFWISGGKYSKEIFYSIK